MLEQLLQEVEQIDQRAHEMALAVLEDDGEREALSEEAQRLADRLDDIVTEIQIKNPEAYRVRGHMISETTLDLDYVEKGARFVSMRIGRKMQQKDRQ